MLNIERTARNEANEIRKNKKKYSKGPKMKPKYFTCFFRTMFF